MLLTAHLQHFINNSSCFKSRGQAEGYNGWKLVRELDREMLKREATKIIQHLFPGYSLGSPFLSLRSVMGRAGTWPAELQTPGVPSAVPTPSESHCGSLCPVQGGTERPLAEPPPGTGSALAEWVTCAKLIISRAFCTTQNFKQRTQGISFHQPGSNLIKALKNSTRLISCPVLLHFTAHYISIS